MRIFFVNPRFDPARWEGARVHITQLIGHLERLGHEVWTFDYLPAPASHRLSASPGARFRELRRMDAFYFRFEGRPLALPRFLRRPFRALFRSPWILEMESTGELGAPDSTTPRRRARDGAIVRRLARRASMAVCVTDGLARYARDLGIERAVVIPNGADPDLFSPSAAPCADVPANPGGLNVLWAGNASVPWHDLDALFRAADLLRGELGIRFYLVGKDLPSGATPPNVVRLPQRPYPEMPSLLARMDVGLCLYRAETWSRYGTFSSPLKLFEYLSMGLIVVASPIEQVRRCFERDEAGFIVPFEDPAALAERLLHVRNHKAQLAPLRDRARRLVTEYYNWPRVARETAEAIRAVLSPSDATLRSSTSLRSTSRQRP